MHGMEVQLTSFALDPERDPLRRPPRPLTLRHEDFEDRFDFTTLFYDCFWDAGGEGIVLLGPPLLNLEADLGLAFTALPSGRPCAVRLVHGVHVSRLHLVPPAGTTGLIVEAAGRRACLVPQPGLAPFFQGRRVLVTLSRNNELVWIRDWVLFHQRLHGCDAVLLYDNASDRYGPGDIRETLAAIEGLRAVVVPWPFKYGVFDGRLPVSYQIWDSLYCQSGMLEHARRRFLGHARSVLNGDVDELVVTPDGSRLFDLVEASPTGLVIMDGLWVENHPPRSGPAAALPPRHRDHHHVRAGRRHGCEDKWAVVPARVPDAAQWRVHEITGMAPSDGGRRAQLRHFKAINTDWDVDRLGSLARRTASSPLDPALLEPDPLLQEALARAFAGDAGPPEAAAPPVRSPWRLRLRGGRLAAEGRLDEAIAAARAAVGRLPEHPGFRLFLARLLERSGQGDEAAALRAEAEAVRLKDGLYHYQCGRRLLDEEEFAPAARALRRALRIKPTLAAAWLELARLSQRLGRPAQARRHLQRCAERVPDDPMGRAALAERLAGDGLISPALAHIEAAIARAPANPHYHVLHAELLWRMGRLDAAERAARQGMALDDLPTRLREFGDHLAARGNLGYQRWILPTAPEAACELARILLTKGDLAAAEAAVREALAVLPTRPETHEQLAGILARRGRDPEAAEALARAIALARQEVEQPVAQNLATLGQRERAEYRELRLARLLGAAGRKDEAVLVLREAVARLPASIPLQEGLAMALAAAGEPRAAAELLRAAIRRQPRNAGLCLAFCRVLEPVDPARALEAARDACRLDPDCPFFHSRLGVLLMQADELDAAAAALERAVTLAPEDASGHWRLGQLLERRGRLPEALAEFRRALELDPGQAWLWSHLGGLLTEAGELDEAEAALDRALALAPDDALGRYRLGRLLERRGRPAAALAEFRRAAALDPDQAWLWSHLGGLLMEADAFDEAEAALERAAALAPDAALTHFRLAQLLSRRGRPEAALAATRRAAELGLEQAWLWSHLGGQLTEAGALEEAEAALERAVALAPEVALNHLRLAELLQRRGRSEEALAAARRAAELDPTSEHIRALLIEAERRSRRAVLLRRAQLASDHAYRRSKHLEYEVWQSLQYVTVSDINSIDMRLFPDFLIIGPQRTGSTWLYKRLGLHPQIYVPNEKEIYYFNNLHTSSFHPKTFPAVSPDLSWYLEHFRETEEERARRDASCRTLFNEPYDPSVRGEGTATYAAGLMPEVVDEIVILNPHIKVILLVRNPVERAWSHAKLNVPWGGNAPLDWHNSDQHAELLSRTDYDQFIEYFNRPYQIACSRFSKIIEMWKPRLRDGHLFLGRFEDISSNPESLLLAIFDFLGVRSDRKYMCEDAAKHVLPTPFLPLPGYLRTYLQQLFDDEFENLAKLGFRWE